MKMSEPNGPEMDQVFFLHRIPLMLDGIQSSLHGDGMPNNDSVRQEIQAPRLMGLAVLILLRHRPFACKEAKWPQIMELFACVELRMDTPALGFILQHRGATNPMQRAQIYP